MKTPLYFFNRRFLLAAGIALAACLGFSVAAAETPPQEPSSALLRLQELGDQQNKRIDWLYNALGPHLYSVAISVDGRWLAAGRQGEYVVCEMPTGALRRTSESSEQD